MSFILEISSPFDNCGLVVISTRLPRSRLRAMQPKFTCHAFDWFWLDILSLFKKVGWRTILILLEWWKGDHKSNHIICNFWCRCITSDKVHLFSRLCSGNFLFVDMVMADIASDGCVDYIGFLVLLLIWRAGYKLTVFSCHLWHCNTNSLDFFRTFFRWHGKLNCFWKHSLVDIRSPNHPCFVSSCFRAMLILLERILPLVTPLTSKILPRWPFQQRGAFVHPLEKSKDWAACPGCCPFLLWNGQNHRGNCPSQTPDSQSLDLNGFSV